ncbi:SDR family NAD(P)-dependent oxidoreductase [Altererythrobacter sp. MF3-039]|uniref:SDR family NAD(P)-dependent oxidoreductase n=1 Tax=Altererythrobacter sp. MF3-039 TaxID=3252901 RepID=UPI00390CC5D7
MRAIEGMSVLVTGASSGIGEETARYLASQGARVTATARRQDRLDMLAEEIGPNCRVVAGDVTEQADREAMLAAALEHGGGLEALVNNAGAMFRQPVDSYTEEHLRQAFDTNVISGMMLSSMAVPHLEKSEGSITFIGSTHTRRAFAGASPYATTKAAVEGLTRVMAAELGPRQVRVNCILPGAVITELNTSAGVMKPEDIEERYAAIAREHVLGRIGTARELAEGIEYLIRAEWVTGVALEVDGGIGLGASAGVATKPK